MNKLIVVLGMHRSGTSTVTRSLKIMGIDLGDKMMPPVEGNNPKGFWEDIDINALNIEMMHALSSDWHYLTFIDAVDVETLRSKGFFLRAVDLIRKKIGHSPSFGFKDPRVAKLLPFWKEVINYCQFDVSYILAIRNPRSVVKSLVKRDCIEESKGYFLWLGHVIASLKGSSGKNRVLVDYDILMHSPDHELERIAQNLDLEINDAELQSYKKEFLDHSLRHTIYQPSDLMLDDACPPLVYEIYTKLLEIATDQSQIDTPDFQEKIEQWADEFARIKSALQLVDRLCRQREAAVQSLAECNGQTARLNQAVAERDGQIADLVQTRESFIIDRDSQKAEIEQLQGAFIQLSQEYDQQIAQLKHVVAERDEQIESMNMELSALYNSKSWRLTSPLRKLVRWGAKLIAFPSYCSKKKSQIKASITKLQPEAPCRILGNNKVTANGNTFRILLVSHYCPTRAHAGGLRILDIYALIRKQCPSVQLDLLTHHRPTVDWSLDEIYRIFHNVYLSPVEDLTPATLAALRGSSLTYDVVDLQFHHSGHHIDEFKHIGGKIIFTPMESAAKALFLDLRTNFHVNNFLPLRRVAALIRAATEEIVFTQKVDEVVCVSRADAAFLRAVTSSRHICGIDTGVSQFEFEEALAPDYATIRATNKPVSVLYVAYFGSETNVLALRWYLEHVHPLVKARVPEYKLTVVGRGNLSPFFKYCDKSIEFVGEVPTIAPHIKEARVSIAPALGGSGFRGKVNQYAVLGCPCVVSPIAFKGLSYKDGVSIFIAETPEIFADRCIRLLTDLELNDRMGKAARQLCLDRYSWPSKWAAIRRTYELQEVE